MVRQGTQFNLPVQRLTTGACVAIFSALYVPITLLNASRKQFWNDELFTFYIARLSPVEVWNVLLASVDQHPPPFYMLTRAAMALPLDPLVAMRLPEMIGFWIAGAGTVVLVARYAPPIYGLLASALLLVSDAYPYAYEARPYAIVAGLATLAFASWHNSRTTRPGLWTMALAVSIAGVVSMHYYGILIVGAIAVGELIRTWAERQFRWSIWIALACCLLPIVFSLPLIAAARTYAPFFWSKPAVSSAPAFYTSIMGPVAFAVALLVMFACAVFPSRVRAAQFPEDGRAPRVPAAEAGAVIAWAALPVPAVMAAFTVTGAYNHRYVLSAAIAVCMMIGWVAAVFFGRRLVPALCATVVCFAAFIARDALSVRWHKSDRTPVAEYLQSHAPKDLKLAITDPLMFFELSHQASVRMQSRLVYFANPKLAILHTGTDTPDRGLIGMSRIAPLQIEDLEHVLASGQRFAIFGHPGLFSWLVSELVARRVPTHLAGEFDGRLLLIAEPDRQLVQSRPPGE